MHRKNIAAFTPPGIMPPYGSINQVDDGVEITVRNDGGTTVVMTMSDEDFDKQIFEPLLVRALRRHDGV